MHIQRNFKLSCNQLDIFYRVVMERDKVQEWTMENAFKRNFLHFHGLPFPHNFSNTQYKRLFV